MRATPPEITYVLCDRDRLASSAKDQRSAEILTAKMRRERNLFARTEASVLSRGRHEKPSWFRAQEYSARRFVQSLGLMAAKGVQISIIDTSSQEIAEVAFPGDGVNGTAMACYAPSVGVIMKRSVADIAAQQRVPDVVGDILVHELVHAAEPRSGICYLQNDERDGRQYSYYREGFLVNRQDGTETGVFFSEAIANFTEGLYNGRCTKVDGAGYHIADPEADVPVQYRVPARLELNATEPISGPNGHIIELLAWGVERHGVGRSGDFLAATFNTYSKDRAVRLMGHRTFAAMVDAIAPGLYPYLRDTEYTKESFAQAHQAVYDVVTDE